MHLKNQKFLIQPTVIDDQPMFSLHVLKTFILDSEIGLFNQRPLNSLGRLSKDILKTDHC